MKLSAILKTTSSRISCELFPPKTDQGEENLWQCLQQLQAVNPAYISVTYGAGGTTQSRTQRIVKRIKSETTLDPVAHLTCVGSTRDDINTLLDQYQRAGIENILALRGDSPEGMGTFKTTAGGFSYATDLTRFIHQRGDFSIAVATYPEGHPESSGGIDDDIRYLKEKQDCGAICAITQYFFDNESFYRFRDAACTAGVNIPLIPGIMPVSNYHQIVRFSSMCGANIPDWLHKKMATHADDLAEIKNIGLDIAVKQCLDLLAHDVPSLHFYTLNKAEMTLAIYQHIKDHV
ncbi:MAG: methylenetetrahydrofolate reductase [NAD(P)H] [Mariprofundaceae bacterium]|nr:methylenetetrahydrofolate reductase [NAD(P)H] [Mariprofundaceae bacterium]